MLTKFMNPTPAAHMAIISVWKRLGKTSTKTDGSQEKIGLTDVKASARIPPTLLVRRVAMSSYETARADSRLARSGGLSDTRSTPADSVLRNTYRLLGATLAIFGMLGGDE